MSLTDYAAVVIAIVLAVLALGGAIELYGRQKNLERRLDRLEDQKEDPERGSDGDSIYENWDRSDAHIGPYHVLDVQAAYQAGCGRCLYLLDRVNSAFTGALGEQDRADNQEWQTLYEELEAVNRQVLEDDAELQKSYDALQKMHNNLDYDYRALQDRHEELQKIHVETAVKNVRRNGTTTPEPDDWNAVMREQSDAALRLQGTKKPKRPYTRKKATPAPVLESLLD